MLFNSPLFLFLFLPLTLGLFYVQALFNSFRAALATLVLCSLIFYAYWNPLYLLLLLMSIMVNYQLSHLLRRRVANASGAKRFLWLGIMFNLALIGYFKYANFFVAATGDITGFPLFLDQVVLPLGISFFTFQQITWLVDIYRGNKQRYDLLEYTQFVTFFPQLIAGPIVHHHEMMPQFNQTNMLSHVSENLSVGLTLFIIGLFKKVVLADSIALHATPVFDAAATGVTLTLYEAWVGALAYTLQLYFDFSGYSDMAIGLARMFGIRLPINFNSPYKATSIIDFWRRWHITLSRFLRDYLYIPLGGNQRGSGRRYLNIAITMILGGLWHGAGWTFLIWGGLHGFYLIINHGWKALAARFSKPLGQADECPTGSPLYRFAGSIVSHGITLFCLIAAWVVFRAESLDAAISHLRSMFGLNGIALPTQLEGLLQGRLPESVQSVFDFGKLFGNELFTPSTALLWIIALGTLAIATPNSQQILSRFQPVLQGVEPAKGLLRKLQWSPTPLWSMAISALALYTLLHLSRVSEFLYFQF